MPVMRAGSSEKQRFYFKTERRSGMETTMTIDQLKKELESVKDQNQRILEELHDVKNENHQLRIKFQQDREWAANKLEIISQNQIQGSSGFSGPCYCGLAAVLEQAKKRASMGTEPS